MSVTKLLFILYDRPNYPGGPIINYTRILPALVGRGYEVHVLVLFWDDYPNGRSMAERGVCIHPEPFINDSRDAVKWILRQAADIQPDVFIPDVSTPGCFAGKWLKASGVPIITSTRSPDDNNMGRAVYFSDPTRGYAVSAVFCVSNFLLRNLQEKVKNPDLTMAVIPSGVPIPDLERRDRNGALSIVYAGRIIQRDKRIFDVTKAFISLAAMNNTLKFTFVGDGPERPACMEIVAENGLQDRVSFTGMLQGDDYKCELAKHDVIVLLSDYEGMPGSMLDGMSVGLIPVCYHYPGADELVKDGITGMLVSDRDTSVIKAVIRLIEDEGLRAKLSSNARNHIIGNYSIDAVLDHWEDLISRLLTLYASKKKPFVMPRKIKLPPPHPLLMEHWIVKKNPFIKRLYSKLSLWRQLKKVAGLIRQEAALMHPSGEK